MHSLWLGLKWLVSRPAALLEKVREAHEPCMVDIETLPGHIARRNEARLSGRLSGSELLRVAFTGSCGPRCGVKAHAIALEWRDRAFRRNFERMNRSEPDEFDECVG